MDMDIAEITSQNTQSEERKHLIAPVDDAHPFDLDSYISGYSGKRTSNLIHSYLCALKC